MTSKPNTHGGAGRGQGRKPSGKAFVPLTVSLPPETKARIQAMAVEAGVSASEIVRRKFA